MTADPARKEKGPAGCWASSPRPGASAPNGGDRGSEPRQALRGRSGPRLRRRQATLPSLLSPPGAEGPGGAAAATTLRGGSTHSPAGRGGATGVFASAVARAQEPAPAAATATPGPSPHSHTPPGPAPAPPQQPQPPLQPPPTPRPLRGSANRLEEGRALAPAAATHNLRPQPATYARGGGGRAHAAGGGNRPHRHSPAPSPPAYPRGCRAAELSSCTWYWVGACGLLPRNETPFGLARLSGEREPAVMQVSEHFWLPLGITHLFSLPSMERPSFPDLVGFRPLLEEGQRLLLFHVLYYQY